MKKLALIITVILMAGCKPVENKVKGGTPVAFNQILQEEYNGKEIAGNEVIKTQEELNKLYNEIGLGDAPKFDFTGKTVVALFMGQKNNGGYAISIDNATDDGKIVTVVIKKKSPDGIATMALTQPYYIGSVATTKEIIFK